MPLINSSPILFSTPSLPFEQFSSELAAARFRADVAQSIQERLDLVRLDLRPKQIIGLERVIDFIINGGSAALIKKPPAAGKSRMFGEIIAGVNRPSIVLVPTTNLRKQTPELLAEVGIPENQILLIDPSSKRSVISEFQRVSDLITDRDLKAWAMIMTYRSLMILHESDPAAFISLMDIGQIIVSDESQKSLGRKTKGVLLEGERSFAPAAAAYLLEQFEREEVRRLWAEGIIHAYEREGGSPIHFATTVIDDGIKAIQRRVSASHDSTLVNVRRGLSLLKYAFAERLAEPEQIDGSDSPAERAIASLNGLLGDVVAIQVEKLIAKSRMPHFHFRFSATPQGTEKEYGIPTIYSVRIQDMIDEGTLIFPSYVSVGRAIHRTSDQQFTATDTAIRELCATDRFVMEDGRSVLEAVTESYLQKRAENGGYLPAVAFCQTIKQAENVRSFLASRGLIAVRCTSANKDIAAGVDPVEAKRRLQLLPDDPDRVDVVVTVRQVGLGWDVRTLRCALWYTVVYSPALSLQSNGRVMRSLTYGDPWPEKSSNNTFIIEPQWQVLRTKFSLELGSEPRRSESPSRVDVPTTDALPSTTNDQEMMYLASNSFEVMAALEELDVSLLLARGIPLCKVPINLQSEDHLRIVIGSVDRLLENGRPSDLKKLMFSHNSLGWSLRGSAIMGCHFPSETDGTRAARQLAMRLWPEEAKAKIFDHANDDHLRALIGSPTHLFSGKALLGSLFRCDFSCPDKNWHYSGKELGMRLFDTEVTGRRQVLQLLERLWPCDARFARLDFTNKKHLRYLVGEKNRFDSIADPTKEIFCDSTEAWKMRGWQLVLKLAQLCQGEFSSPKDLLQQAIWGPNPLVVPEGEAGREYTVAAQTNTTDERRASQVVMVYTSIPKSDPARRLEVLCQRLDVPLPTYKLIQARGPDHQREFIVSCEAFGGKLYGGGASIALAKKCAAQNHFEVYFGLTLPPEVIQEHTAERTDYKSRLHNAIAGITPRNLPQYTIIGKSRPGHSVTIRCTALGVETVMTAHTKAAAEQLAAKECLNILKARGSLEHRLPPWVATNLSQEKKEQLLSHSLKLREKNKTMNSLPSGDPVRELREYVARLQLKTPPEFVKIPRSVDSNLHTMRCRVGNTVKNATSRTERAAMQWAAKLVLNSLKEAEESRQRIMQSMPGHTIHRELPPGNPMLSLMKYCHETGRGSVSPKIEVRILNPNTPQQYTEATCILGDMRATAYATTVKGAQKWAVYAMVFDTLMQGDHQAQMLAAGKTEVISLTDRYLPYLQRAQQNPERALETFCGDFFKSKPTVTRISGTGENAAWVARFEHPAVGAVEFTDEHVSGGNNSQHSKNRALRGLLRILVDRTREGAVALE